VRVIDLSAVWSALRWLLVAGGLVMLGYVLGAQ
jgi:hypothetical protein